jgi:chromosome partitioning protein
MIYSIASQKGGTGKTSSSISLAAGLAHKGKRVLLIDMDSQANSSNDFVFVDNPPALGWLTINSFTASDRVLVVVSPGYFELDSLMQLGKTLNEVKECFNKNLELLGYLFTMSDPTINTSTSLQILRQTYTSKVFNTIIPKNVDLKDALFNKMDIFTFDKHSKAAQAYDRLIREVFLNEPVSEANTA